MNTAESITENAAASPRNRLDKIRFQIISDPIAKSKASADPPMARASRIAPGESPTIIPTSVAPTPPVPWRGRNTKKATPRKPEAPSSGRVKRVMLARFSEEVRFYWRMVGVIEGYVGDEVLVRFGEVVVQVPAEWLAPI